MNEEAGAGQSWLGGRVRVSMYQHQSEIERLASEEGSHAQQQGGRERGKAGKGKPGQAKGCISIHEN